MKTVILTGATSFLGRNVLKGLIREHIKVYALVRRNSKDLWRLPKDENVEYVYGSLDTLAVLENVVRQADTFIHFAWDGSGYEGRASHEIQSQNVNYAMDALRLAKKLGCAQFIFPGSQAEYGICDGVIQEDTSCHPVSEYGKAKLDFSERAMAYCKDINMAYIHLRIFSIYGTDDRTGTLIDACVKGFNQGELVKLGPCTQNWNYLYIDDFVNLMLSIVGQTCPSGIYNVGGTESKPLRDFVLDIYALSNQTGGYEFGTEVHNPEGTPQLQPNITKVKQQIGWEPKIEFADGICQIARCLLGGSE